MGRGHDLRGVGAALGAVCLGAVCLAAACLAAAVPCGPLDVDSSRSDVADVRETAADSCASGAGATGALLQEEEESAVEHPALDTLVLYELQVRSANACDPSVGSEEAQRACAPAARPPAWSRAIDSTCELDAELERIRLGTFDDLLIDTDHPEVAVSLRYVDERVGANAVWLQPVFPNNDRRLLPDPCDTLGSPYAVRDYFHTRGTLSAQCISTGSDEYSAQPCWGDSPFNRVIDAAHDRGPSVFLDVALNHFGHDYLFYDVAGARTTRDHLRASPAEQLWDFESTFDEALVWPAPIGSPGSFVPGLWSEVERQCPSLAGEELVRAAAMYRVAFDDERADFACGPTLEATLPAFYLGADNWGAARAESQTTTAYGWRDVKFLFHRADNAAQQREFLRVREYGFRIVNYCASRGIDRFRLDHATDGLSGMSADEWRYITEKVAYYAALRGDPAPIWLAEEFHSQDAMSEIADILTEGYLFGITGRDRPMSSGTVQATVDSVYRFVSGARVLIFLENHDELRIADGTAWDAETGAGVWALGASTRSTPMLLVGQEWGETGRLQFRRPHVIAGRFDGTASGEDRSPVTPSRSRCGTGPAGDRVSKCGHARR